MFSQSVEGYDLHENGKMVYGYNGSYGTDIFTDKARQIIEQHDPNQVTIHSTLSRVDWERIF